MYALSAIHIQGCVYVYMFIGMQMHVCVYIICLHTYVDMLYVYVYVYICVHTYTYRLTHVCVRCLRTLVPNAIPEMDVGTRNFNYGVDEFSGFWNLCPNRSPPVRRLAAILEGLTRAEALARRVSSKSWKNARDK